MNMKDGYGHVFEEAWYITHNENFQNEVKKLRITHKLPAKGLLSNAIEWIDSTWNFEEKNKFSNDLKKLFLRSKGAKGESWFVFNPMVTTYILTNQLETAFYGLPHEIEDVIRIKKLENKIEVTLLLGYDSTIEHINDVLKTHWKTIQKMQKDLAGNKIRSSVDFELKTKFWEAVKKHNKSPQNVYEDPINGNRAIPPAEIDRLIRAMDTRIAASFE